MAQGERTKDGGWNIKKDGRNLWFWKSPFSPEGVSRIKEAFNANHSLENLHLGHSRLTDDSVDTICNLLKNNHRLSALWLNNCNFTEKAVQGLFNALAKNRSLIGLNMESSKLTDSSISALCDFAERNTVIEILWFKNSSLTDSAAQHLLTWLAGNKKLEFLSLEDSHLSDVSIQCADTSPLKCLDLRSCQFGDDDMEEIMTGLRDNKSLQEISFKYSVLTKAVPPAMAKFVLKNSTLKVLDVGKRLPDDEVARVLYGLAENTSLKEFTNTEYDEAKQEAQKAGVSIRNIIAGKKDPACTAAEEEEMASRDNSCYTDPTYIKMFNEIPEGIKDEIQQQKPRLVGPTGLGALAEQAVFIAHISSLKILQEDDIQTIEAATIKAEKAKKLVECLLPCKPSKVVGFAWLLVQMDQDHQFPKTITQGVKSWLKKYTEEEIQKLIASN